MIMRICHVYFPDFNGSKFIRLIVFSISFLAKAILVCVVVLVRFFLDNRQRDLALTEGLHLLRISVSQSWLWKQSNSNKEYYTPEIHFGTRVHLHPVCFSNFKKYENASKKSEKIWTQTYASNEHS